MSNGQSWVLVDSAILDVSNFSQRHPGGARLIKNAVGTDITQELLGQDLSVGHAMSFSPHVHQEVTFTSAVIFSIQHRATRASTWFKHMILQQNGKRNVFLLFLRPRSMWDNLFETTSEGNLNVSVRRTEAVHTPDSTYGLPAQTWTLLTVLELNEVYLSPRQEK